MQGSGKDDDGEEMEDDDEGRAGRWGDDGPGKNKPAGGKFLPFFVCEKNY